MGKDLDITAYGIPIAPFTSFKYLGRFIFAVDNDWPEVVQNLHRERQKWVRQTQVLSREGEDARTFGQIYFVVVRSVMLYRLELWVLTPRMKRVWGGFHHRVSHSLTRRKPRIGRYGEWVYPPLEDAMA